jgi:hypothetical protein
LWLNPAGIVVDRSASVHADVVVRHPGRRDARFGQATIGFGSRGFAFGYQHDDFAGVRGHSYRFGLAGSTRQLAVGAAAAWYRGGASTWGYSVGATLRATPRLVIGVTAANIAQPVVRGVKQAFTTVPEATFTPFGPRLELSALGRVGGAGESYAVGLRWGWPGSLGGAVTARLDADGELRQRGLAFGLAIGRQDQVGVVATTRAGTAGVDAASLYGVAARPLR